MNGTARTTSAPAALLVAAAAASAAMLIALNSQIGFFFDEWDLLLHRRGFDADAFLRPHNEHIVLGPAIVYKAIQATLGMESTVPYQVAAIAVFVTSAVLVFVWVRRSAGPWLGLLAAIAILFLGSAWEDLLSAFQIGFFGSAAAGLGALLALERGTLRADALACLLLVVSVSFSSLGLPLLAAAAVAIALADRPPARAWIVAVPAMLFALWWAGWGHTADVRISFASVANAPAYVVDGFAASIASLLGLAPADTAGFAGQPAWGRPLLLVAVAAAAWRVRRIGAVSDRLWVVLALGLSFWLLVAVNAAMVRLPTLPRYMYIGVIVCVLIAAELGRGARLSRTALIAVAAVAAVAVAGNLVNLREGFLVFRDASQSQRAGITALELARDTVAPDLALTEENSGIEYFGYVDAGSYLSAADAYGSPAYTEAELREASESVRTDTDRALIAALPVELVSRPGPVSTASPPPTSLLEDDRPVPGDPGCAEVDPRQFGTTAVELPPGGALVRAGSRDPVRLRIRRYPTASFPTKLEPVPAGAAALIRIPPDRGETPWQLQLFSSELLTVCGVRR